MKLKRLHIFLLHCCVPMHMMYSMQPNEIQWGKDVQVMYDIIEKYTTSNGVLSTEDQKNFKETLDLLEQEIDQLNPEKYDIAEYKKTYLNSYKEWESYIDQASADRAQEKEDKTATQVAIQKAKVQEDTNMADTVATEIVSAKNADAKPLSKQKTINKTSAKKTQSSSEKKVVAKKQLPKAAKKEPLKKIDESAWLEKALAMYEILDAYSQNGYVSAEQQEAYSNYLDSLEKEINALNPKQYTAKDIADYNAVYVDPYKQWSSFIIEETDTIKAPSPEEIKIEAYAAKRQEIYQSVEQQIIMYADEFAAEVESLLEGLGEYSKASQEALYKDLESQVATFESYMKTVKNNAINSYFSYLKAQGEKVDALHLTPQQHELVSGVGKMTAQAITQIEAIVLDLTTTTSAAVFASQAANSFMQYEKQTEAGYQAALEANRRLGDKNGWDALKNAGSRIMKSFGVKMQDAIQKQAEEQVQIVLEEKGAELAQVIGKKAAAVGGATLEKIKDKANEIGGDAFAKLKERADAVGGETLAEFKKKVSDLGNNVINKVPSQISQEVKKLISNQIGVDADALVNLLSSKDVSPEDLRKVIISRFPVSAEQEKIAAQVSQNSNLCAEEKVYIKNRLKIVEETLREEFEIEEPLRLAFSFSGGGNRAMIGTLGLCISAARHKFLDAAMYLTGLSGSTWTIAPWSYMHLKGLLNDDTEASEENALEYSLQQFKSVLADSLDYVCPLTTCPGDIYPPDTLANDIELAFANSLAKRFAYNQRITAVNLWGALVSNYALKKVGSDRLNITWSSIAQEAEKGMIPLPICSSVFDLQNRTDDKIGYRAGYEWFESGPFEAGSKSLGFIPVWALGSSFKDGKIVTHAPEYEISQYLGIYGSAFAVSINDLIDKGIPLPTFKVANIEIKLPVDSWVRNLIDGVKSDLRAKRSEHIHAGFANYSKGLEGSALKDKEEIDLFDAGLSFNIPLPLLFDRAERAIDVAIMYDSNPVDMQCLIDASRYFEKNGIAIPSMENDPVTGKPISQAGLLSRLMTVFNDPRNAKSYNPEQPTLIYFPTPKTDISKIPYYIQGSKVAHYIDLADYPNIKSPIDNSKSPYVTSNFKYSLEEFENLSQTMEAVFESQVDEIKLIMQLVSEKKSRKAIVQSMQPSKTSLVADKKEAIDTDNISDVKLG